VRLVERGVVAQIFPDTYRLTAVELSDDGRMRAARLWAGSSSAAHGRSSGAWYALEHEALEIACEDARRHRLTSVPALRAYVDRHARG
jgi:hypothetical protein